MGVRPEVVELRRVALPLVRPFASARTTERVRDALLVRVRGPQPDGWGECVAMSTPTYTSEFVDAAHLVVRDHLAPRLLAAGSLDGAGVARVLASVKGHPMAKAAIELAVLDAELRGAGRSLAAHLGGVRTEVDCGVAVGTTADVAALLDEVAGHLAAGYRRVKLKIHPGWDVEPVRAVRDRFGDVPLQVDANGSYEGVSGAADALGALDDYGLLLVEQPLGDDDLAGHAELARRMRTPICLDESVTSAAAAVAAIDAGACRVVNVKPGRVGGVLEAVRVHDACRARGVPVWCGGMIETGIGRAANVALAALAGFTLPGDLSGSSRWFHRDVTPPVEPVDGRLPVPSGPGIGVEPDPDALAALTTSVEEVRPVSGRRT